MRFGLVTRFALPLFLGCVTLTGPGFVYQAPALAAPQVSSLAVEATKLAFAGNFLEAGVLAKRSGDVAAIKLVELLYLRDHPQEAGYNRIMDFLTQSPNWPLADTLTKRAEKTLYSNRESADLILQHFAKRKPVTAEGALALARAMLARGDEAAARKLVQQVWYNPDLEPDLEKSMAAEFKAQLTADDNRQRMWRLVYAQQTNAAVRMSKRLSGDYQKAAKVAQMLIRGAKGAEKQYAKLPAAMRGEAGVKYALVNFYRKRESFAKARGVLAGIPGDAAAMGDPEAWWVERRIVARRSIGVKQKDNAAQAYQIAKAHGIASGPSAVEGEFLAGWIALRWLNDPGKAIAHFNRLALLAPSRTELARAYYWSGRAHEAMGQQAEAVSAYREAAQHTTIYYGQLAREKLGRGSVPEEIADGKASRVAQQKVDHDDVVRAFKLVAEAGRKDDLNMFLWAFATRFKTVDEMNAVASIVWGEGGAAMSVKLAKAASQKNIDIDSWSYPLRAMPDWKPMGKPVEKALVFGLARQESEFNPTAGSTAGAQGLMQLMPGTARLIAKQYGIAYAPKKLVGDPAYNVKLGAAHLGDLVEDFGGSYVLTLVAYNAGPRRSMEWIAEYGDLRRGNVDPIDWVESIPFQETRQYVQKVLQNVHVYRSRLAPDTVRPMSADLARGGKLKIEVAATAAKPNAKCDGGSIAQLISSCE